jgi:hypothetical protein
LNCEACGDRGSGEARNVGVGSEAAQGLGVVLRGFGLNDEGAGLDHFGHGLQARAKRDQARAGPFDLIEDRRDAAVDELLVGDPRVDVADVERVEEAPELGHEECRAIDDVEQAARAALADVPVQRRADVAQPAFRVVDQIRESPDTRILAQLLAHAFDALLGRSGGNFVDNRIEFLELRLRRQDLVDQAPSLVPERQDAVELFADQSYVDARVLDRAPVAQGEQAHGAHGVHALDDAADLLAVGLSLREEQLPDGREALGYGR